MLRPNSRGQANHGTNPLSNVHLWLLLTKRSPGGPSSTAPHRTVSDQSESYPFLAQPRRGKGNLIARSDSGFPFQPTHTSKTKIVLPTQYSACGEEKASLLLTKYQHRESILDSEALQISAEHKPRLSSSVAVSYGPSHTNAKNNITRDSVNVTPVGRPKRSTRQKSVIYDARFHPMDKVTRPNHSATQRHEKQCRDLLKQPMDKIGDCLDRQLAPR